MNTKRWNWRLWVGFGVSLLALLSYFFFFQTTRDVLWVSLALFVPAGALLVSGLKRAFAQPQSYRGKVAGPILTGTSVLILGLFGFSIYVVSKSFPLARNAPKVGQKAPEFALVDSAGKPVSLAQVLAAPMSDSSGAMRAPKGVLLVFYRGYW